MALEIEGRVIQKFPEMSGTSQSTGKTWRKQQFLIETNEQYPKKVIFQVWNDNVELLKDISVGQIVRVYFRVESREYNERWYTDLTAWRIMKFVDANPSAATTQTTTQTSNTPPSEEKVFETLEENDPFTENTPTSTTDEDLSNNEEGDDLPF